MDPSITHPILQASPIRRSKLHELVTEKLAQMIRAGELKPGDKLPAERAIMAAYNIGRPAVREALLSLENRGLIVTENGRRATVRHPSVDNVLTTLNSIVGIIIGNTERLKNLFDARVCWRRPWRATPRTRSMKGDLRS
jgi:DNA-binding FadR family transcriptional regulator